ncbi:carcinoembryonic antigen-related cell adhesion molecule 1 isoform X3 [Apodemus sylvaticus]|uniref:carcinoembryonic antigen-related cell adhesion molecule 1 isoform X3 n=1 Tax=Apodemus sylvaticus TaxID=10129 RepID=UPI0022418DC8|nr:carcinoembryonic antigen-related cell adhesion molecule 1 isoform X3 [Apodemus sylvaticus]
MELASAHRHRGQIPWRGLLLTASLLTSWSLPTTAQVTIEAVPPAVAEGKDVLLLVHNLPQTFQVFYWYKGTTTTDVNNEIGRFVTQTNRITMGPASSGRETIYTNGSLFIQSVTKNDEGVYTLDIIDPDYNHSYPRVQFSVHEEVTPPSIQVTNTTVKEMGSVTLTCLSNDTGISIRWLFNHQSLQLMERMTLSQDNSTLTIHPIRKGDAGVYQCEISNPVSFKISNPIQLEVIADPTPGDSGLSGGAIAGIVIGSVAGVALIAALIYFLYSRKTGGGSDQRDLTEHKPSASSHNLAPSDNSPNKVDDVAYTVLNFNSQQPSQPASAPLSPKATETLYSEVKKK